MLYKLYTLEFPKVDIFLIQYLPDNIDNMTKSCWWKAQWSILELFLISLQLSASSFTYDVWCEFRVHLNRCSPKWTKVWGVSMFLPDNQDFSPILPTLNNIHPSWAFFPIVSNNFEHVLHVITWNMWLSVSKCCQQILFIDWHSKSTFFDTRRPLLLLLHAIFWWQLLHEDGAFF